MGYLNTNQKNEEHQKIKHILVMDDNESILNLLTNFFDYLHINICTSKNGHEAIEIFKKLSQTKNPIDLVILDISIPNGMGAKECLNELLKINPNIKAIVSSGYSYDPIMKEFTKFGFKAALCKPYNLDDLKKIIATI